MSVLVRILMVILAYILACIAAGVILTVSTLAPQGANLNTLDMPEGALWVVIAIAAAMTAAAALLPALLVIALAEGFAWRSSLIYGALGGTLALALSYGFDVAGYIGTPDSSAAHEREVLAAAGIAGGFVYWLFAGRKAGIWK
jgi:hypothetical protein